MRSNSTNAQARGRVQCGLGALCCLAMWSSVAADADLCGAEMLRTINTQLGEADLYDVRGTSLCSDATVFCPYSFKVWTTDTCL